MAQWYVKELSKMTKISVQTLHHYDRINLLKPSIRLANGYRVYSEKDLLKLQQILALKFFGFELIQIKNLIDSNVNMEEHFAAQLNFLEDKTRSLLEASRVLKNILSDCRHHKSIPWETITNLIEVYRMTEQLNNSWAGRVFSPEELKEYAQFGQEMKDKLTAEEQQMLSRQWSNLTAEVAANLKQDPNSTFGIEIGKRCMTWVNSVYGKDHIALRNAIWEKGFKTGQIDKENALTPDVVDWLDKAINAYYHDRTLKVLDQVKSHPEHEVLLQWETLLTDMFGEDKELRKEFYQQVLSEVQVDQVANTWIKKLLLKI